MAANPGVLTEVDSGTEFAAWIFLSVLAPVHWEDCAVTQAHRPAGETWLQDAPVVVREEYRGRLNGVGWMRARLTRTLD
jgi:hypothetical protein